MKVQKISQGFIYPIYFQSFKAKTDELLEKTKINKVETLRKVQKILLSYLKNIAKSEAQACYCENKIAHMMGYDDRASEVAYKYYDLIYQALL